MNFLNILLHHASQQKSQPLTRTQQFGRTGAPQVVAANNRHPAEDDSLVMGPQGHVPLNMLNYIGQGNAYGGNPQQGFGPQVQNIGALQQLLQGSNQRPQLPQLNPQVQDQGYYYF